MMIIQNGNQMNQNPQPVVRVGDDASKVVAAASGVEPGRGVAVELPQIATRPSAPQQASFEKLKQAVDDINKAMRQSDRNLAFSVDGDSQRIVVKLTDTETGEVIRQIPSEETLAIARSIGDFQQGMLLKQKA